MTKYFFLIFCAFFYGQSDAHTYIGNSGEGIQVGDKLHLRDLYESSNYENPYFGPSIDPQIQALVENDSLAKLPFSKELLKRKLSDINNVQNFWGFYLMAVINQYNWVLVNDPLGQLPDDGPILNLPESARVQIANRDLHTIRIHRASWDKLSEESKVALIVHEGFFSLIVPSCIRASTNYCVTMTQSARLARQVTAFFFLPSVGKKIPLPNWIRDALAVPMKPNPYSHGKSILSLSLNKDTLSIENANDAAASAYFIQHACQNFFKDSKGPLLMQVFMTRDPFYAHSSSYSTDYGMQVAMKIVFRQAIYKDHSAFPDVNACKAHLQDITEQWFHR